MVTALPGVLATPEVALAATAAAADPDDVAAAVVEGWAAELLVQPVSSGG